MIKDENFINLKTELSSAIVVFEKENQELNLYFNNHLGFQKFRQNLNQLHYQFINEVRDNLTSLKTNDEIRIYLEMLLQTFEVLNDQNVVFPDFVFPHRNAKMVSKNNENISCVYTIPDDLSRLICYFEYQKKIIQKSIEFVNATKTTVENTSPDCIPISYEKGLKDIYPIIYKLKSELGTIKLICDKIEYLQHQKIILFKRMEEEGKESFLIILKFLFEVILDCMKDLLIIEQDLTSVSNRHSNKAEAKLNAFKNSEEKDNILWLESKAALVELIYALHGSNAIDNNCGIKELAVAFESIFEMEIGDIYHIYHELKNRKLEPTKFIDSLRNAFLRKIEEENEH